MATKKDMRNDNPEIFENTQMQKDMILSLLKEKGCRITKQRQVLIDIILTGNYSCSKEIYYAATKIDSNIGAATVYRMINTLEEIGAISRKNMYKVSCCESSLKPNSCEISFADGSRIELSPGEWYKVVKEGLKAVDKDNGSIITKINVIPCGYCEECEGNC